MYHDRFSFYHAPQLTVTHINSELSLTHTYRLDWITFSFHDIQRTTGQPELTKVLHATHGVTYLLLHVGWFIFGLNLQHSLSLCTHESCDGTRDLIAGISHSGKQ